MVICFSAVDIATPQAAEKRDERQHRPAARLVQASQFIVGIENCAPSLMPDGQRAVTVLVRV
jgi:hypothetical protein